MKIDLFNSNIKTNTVLKSECIDTYASLLTSCSPWIILMVGSLLFVPTAPLSAMEEGNENKKPVNTSPPCEISIKSTSKKYQERELAQGNNHSSTQKRSGNEHLSDRLKQIKVDAKDLDKVEAEKIEQCKEILKCSKDPFISLQEFSEITFDDLIIIKEDKGGGCSGAIVPPPITRNGKRIVIKQFKNSEHGVKELLESLAAWELNHVPATLKMAKICDAAYCINGSKKCLSIIMECASGEDIKACLPKAYAEEAISAFAEYLAEFHIHHHGQLNEIINEEKYLQNASKFVHTLSKNPLDEEEKKEIALLELIVKKQLKDLEAIKSHNILQLLTTEEQHKFAYLVKGVTHDFVKNSSEIYRVLNSKNTNQRDHYFSTRTHGDAHSKNFFFNHSLEDRQLAIAPFHLIEMIDYASLIKTFEKIGDPAEDVGRFLGSLWEWAAQESEPASETVEHALYDKIINLQTIFMDIYSNKIKSTISKKESQQKFEKIFRENCNFYKLRFYRVIFNSTQDPETKLKILRSWLQENADMVDSLQKTAQATKFVAAESDRRHWKSLEGETLYCNLPDPVEGFITSTANGPDRRSYLTELWQMLHEKGIATLTSTATLAGEGGIGKTTLAIAYGHEALQNKAYSLIYRLLGSTEEALLKSYRDLLQELGIQSDQSIELHHAAKLVKEHLPENALFIVDNVPVAYEDGTPAPDFLKDKLPQNKHTHIIITSRSHAGWDSLLSLEAFRPTDSENYLLNITGLKDTEENRNIARKLAEELKHFPLALSHAASYLKLVGGEDISANHFKDYLEGFINLPEEYLEKKKNSLEIEKSKLNYEYLIDKTLRMSKKYLIKEGFFELTKKLLNYCSYLDADFIAEDIFLEIASREQIKGALEKLSALSLIKRGQSQNTFSIHQLLQLVIRNKQESISNQQHQGTFSSIVDIFNTLFKKNLKEEKDIERIGSYFTHFLVLLKHSKDLKICTEAVECLSWAAMVILFNKMIDLGMGHDIKEKLKNETFTKKMNAFPEGIVKHQTNVPEWLIQLTEQSHSIIQTSLALIYFQGDSAKKDDEKALWWFFKAAHQGNIAAKFCLGHMYANGTGVEKDKDKAKQHYEEAAEKGHVEAQVVLGQMNDAEGIYNEAIKWLKRAADQGHPMAQYYLALFYDGESGIMKDPQTAFELYTQSAEQGLDEAQFSLGMIYHKGQNGRSKDSHAAQKWYQMAASQGHTEAQFMLGFICASKGKFEEAMNWLKLAAERDNPISSYIMSTINYLKDLHEGKITTEIFNYINKLNSLQTRASSNLKLKGTEYYSQTIKQNYDMAIDWCCKVLEQKYAESIEIAEDMTQSSNGNLKDLIQEAKEGEAEAQFKLGRMYEIGQSIFQSYNKALKWYLRAATQGHGEAQYKAGVLYANRLGDFQSALSLCTSAANNGHEKAQSFLGALYLVQKDYNEAFSWFSKAAEQDQVDALFLLGDMYYEGRGRAQDFEEALKWYKKAAKQGHEEAPVKLGILYCTVFEDFEEAFRWSRLAAENGFKDAQLLMGMLFFEGLGVDQSYDIAFTWFTKAAVQGHKEAQFVLGCMYFDNLIRDKNQQEAILWLTKAANQGHKGARDMLEHIAQQKDEKAANYRPKLNFKEQLHSSSLQQQNDDYKYFQKQLLSKPEQKDQKSVTGTIHQPLEDEINIQRKDRYGKHMAQGDFLLSVALLEASKYEESNCENEVAWNAAEGSAILASKSFSKASQEHVLAEIAVEEAAKDAKFARELDNQQRK